MVNTSSEIMSKRQRTVKFLKKNYTGWLFNLPLSIGLLMFTAIPVITSLYYSFLEFDGFHLEFIGFANYVKALTRDREIGISVRNTIIYTIVSIPLNLVLSYLLAVLVNKQSKTMSLFRTLFYMPCVIPAVVSGLLWKDILDPNFGIVNNVLKAIGLPASQFFMSAKSAMPSVFLMGVWGIGGGMILWLSAFRNIPRQLYEAASLDGANTLHKLLNITIPLSTPMIFYNLIQMVIGSLQYNGAMTYAPNYGRGVDDSLYMYGLKIYWEAFNRFGLGYASALSWLLLIVVAILTGVMFKTSKWVYYEGGE